MEDINKEIKINYKEENKKLKTSLDELSGSLDNTIKEKSKYKKATAAVGFVLIAVIGVFLSFNMEFTVTDPIAVAGFSFSILFVIIVIGVLFGTGMGQDIYSRFKNRLMFNSGHYVNSLYISKNGVIKEFFKKVDNVTGSFKINEKTYARNPSLLYRYKKIPTYLHREGNPDPLDPFLQALTTEMSEAEIDQVMAAKNTFDLKQWLNTYGMYILIVLCGVIAVGVVSAFFGWTIEQMLTEGTYKAVQCIEPSVLLNNTVGSLG